jgi:DNA-binding response OmpR family regulator
MPDTKMNILLAEDDLNLGILLIDYLEANNFEVRLCKDGEQALHAFRNSSFDLCILDVMMPKLDGFSVAKQIRTQHKTIPIIFITARSMKEDKLRGYDIGADDYITKPFDEEELLWKIKAITRRIGEENGNQTQVIHIGKYFFDYANQSLTIDGKLKRITEKESNILKFLSDNRNKIVKREDILKALWGENDYFLGRSLDVFITKIRKYLQEDKDLSIENVFKVGFILNAP